jgi:general secretion pathway protein I
MIAGNTQNRYDPQRSKNRGFTLVEVLVAMAVIAIVVIAIFKMNAQTIDMTNITRFYTVAPLLAQAKLAEIESKTMADVTNDAGDFGEKHPGFSWQITVDAAVSEMLGEAAANLKKIDVAVTYHEKEAAYTITTYRFFPE